VLYLKRTLKRLDVTSRSLIALIEPGSCFAGSLLELALAADRSYMLAGVFEDVGRRCHLKGRWRRRDHRGRRQSFWPRATPLPMGNELTRLAARFLGDERLAAAEKSAGFSARGRRGERSAWSPLPRTTSTGTRRCGSRVEERASFSPDALTGLEANYGSPARRRSRPRSSVGLTAWQNWIFYRRTPRVRGALRAYGTAGGRTSTGSEFEVQHVDPDYAEKIPNNVGLAEDRRLQRALESWQPDFCPGG